MNLFLIILLVVLGYIAAFALAMSVFKNWQSINTIAITVLLIYGSVVGSFILLSEYLGEPGLVVYAMSIVLPIIYGLWKIYSLTKERPNINFGALFALIAYIAAVLFITTFMRDAGSNNRIQMELFNWAQDNALESFRHVLLNVAMFVPLGALFPFIAGGDGTHPISHVVSGTSFGVFFSAMIETGQLLTSSGTCDVDDIVSNGFGAFLGALAMSVILWQNRKNLQ